MSNRTDDVVGKVIVPGAAAVLGAAAGWFATKRRPSELREALPDLPNVDLGDITGDLKDRVESVVSRSTELVSRSTDLLTNHKTESRTARSLSADELEQRRRERAQRRRKRQRSRT